MRLNGEMGELIFNYSAISVKFFSGELDGLDRQMNRGISERQDGNLA
jgi:hypothetical protein